MALKTNYKQGDPLHAEDLNEAFKVINIFRQILDGEKAIAQINDKDVLSGLSTTLTANDIKMGNGKTIEATVTDAITNISLTNPAKVTVVQNRALNDLTTHGMYYVIKPTANHPENTSMDVYVQVIKTSKDFFVQQCWTSIGNVYTRVRSASGGFGEWKKL